MNYYAARELKDAEGKGRGLWHYTCLNDGAIWPEGHCSPFRRCPVCNGKSAMYAYVRPDVREEVGLADCQACGSRGSVRVDNPCPGHDTPEGAEEHYRQYLLDEAVFRVEFRPSDCCEYPGCGVPTNLAAETGPGRMRHHALCEAHNNRDGLEKVMHGVGTSCSSY